MDTAPACFNGGMMHKKHEWYITHDFEDGFAPVGECVCGEQFDEGEIEHRLNCFDELVEALEQVQSWLEGESPEPWPTKQDAEEAYRLLRVADAALATAKGEQSE
jgi:hypothetical protein